MYSIKTHEHLQTLLLILTGLLQKHCQIHSYFCSMIKFLFKQPKPRQFDLKPRFYNERKEYIQARSEAIEWEMNASSTEAGGEVFRSRITRSWNDQSFRKSRLKSNKMVIIIAGFLFLLAYFLLYM